MKIGSDRCFVEFEISERVDDWIFGCFCFVIGGFVIGDPSDRSVDLKGCLRWLEEFLCKPVNRFEPGLFEMPKEQAFLRLGASVLADGNAGSFASEAYNDTYNRFHISQLGMSSFDSVILLLMHDEERNSRLVWKDGGGLYDVVCPAGEFERVLKDTVVSMKNSMFSIG